MVSTGLLLAAVLIFALGTAAGAAFVYQQKLKGDTPRFFAQRSRRLAFVERAALEGGRKLLLVRRDGVEHLILVGGPIDLVVETGIRCDAEQCAAEKMDMSEILAAAPFAVVAEPPLAHPSLAVETSTPAGPKLPLSAKGGKEDKPLVLQAAQEAKAAE
jgi:flagellar protein FliO/FliZ